MRIYRAKDYDEMSRKAANIIAAQMTLKPDSVLGLATGSTPIGTYRELIARYSQGDIDFSRIKTAGRRGRSRDPGRTAWGSVRISVRETPQVLWTGRHHRNL